MVLRRAGPHIRRTRIKVHSALERRTPARLDAQRYVPPAFDAHCAMIKSSNTDDTASFSPSYHTAPLPGCLQRRLSDGGPLRVFQTHHCAHEAGAFALKVAHRRPERQSPVAQCPMGASGLPLAPNLHPVRAQMVPIQSSGTCTVLLLPAEASQPVGPGIVSLSVGGGMAGQTV